MKKLICLVLATLMVIPFMFTACGSKAEALSFGLGVYTTVSSASDATEDVNGAGKATITVAAVTVDADGKIVDCILDTADFSVEYTVDGKAVANESFQTKREQGDNYGMKAWGTDFNGDGTIEEWYKQADAFAKLVSDKTLDEVKALVVNGDKGTEEVINAGCTITVNEFVLAIEKAYNNAKTSEANVACDLKLGVYTAQTPTDANEDKNGQNKTETTFFASAVDADGKIVAVATECVQVTFTFDANGVSTFDTTKAVSGKREQGDNYGMKNWGTDLNGDGTIKEWYEQADAFEALCIGKTAAEVSSLMAEDNYGTADVKAAGCTILVNGFVKAAEKTK